MVVFFSLLQCFTPKDLHSFDNRSTSKALNVTEFQELSPVILFCLLPARELNSSNTPCNVYPKNHSELFIEFAKNFSQGKHGITIGALDRILEAINQTIGQFLVKKKVGIKKIPSEKAWIDSQAVFYIVKLLRSTVDG